MKLWQLLLASLVVFLPSCGLVHIQTNNCPWFYGSSFEVINNSTHYLEVRVRGRQYAYETKNGAVVERLPPGETMPIGLLNLSGNGMGQDTVSLKAYDQPTGDHLPLGAAVRHVYVSGYYNQAETWIVCDQTFKQPCYGY